MLGAFPSRIARWMTGSASVDLQVDDARHVCLHPLARAPRDPLDDPNRVRVVVVRPEDHVQYDRHSGRVLPDHRAAVEEELARLNATVAERWGGSVDLDRASTADGQGIGGPSASAN